MIFKDSMRTKKRIQIIPYAKNKKMIRNLP